MSKQSAENYLDELLNSVNREKKHNELMEADEDFVRELKGAISADTAEEIKTTRKSDSSSVVKMSAKAEAEFLMEFEKELEGEDFDDFLKNFEEDGIQPEDRLESADMEITDEDALMSMLGGSMDDAFSDTPVDIPDESGREEISLEELALSGIEIEEPMMGPMEEPDLSADSGVSPVDAIDLSQMGEEDLISLLAGTDDLADIGALLAQNDNEVPVNAEDPFAEFAAGEMAEQAEAVGTESTADHKTKKGGFLEKLTSLLFGKDSDAEETVDSVTLGTSSAPGVEELSDENAQILAAFAEADKTDAADMADKKKGKKEKKKKEPKPKKPAKPKAPKKPKEKKPKEKDNTPPLPKGPVALVCVLAISIFVLVFFGTDLINYSSAMSKAKDLYKMGHYTEAAAAISGIVIKDEDVMFDGKIATLAAVDSQLSEYEVFMKSDRKAEALDSLISAAGRVEVNDDNTMTFDCVGEMGVLKDEIIVELQEQFDMTYEKALELYQLTELDRDEYTVELNKIMKELGIITE